MSYFHRVFRIAMEDTTDSPIEALAAQAVQAEAVSSGLAEAAEEVAQMEAATAAELGLTTEELEIFMDGDDGEDDLAALAVPELGHVVAVGVADGALPGRAEPLDFVDEDADVALGVVRRRRRDRLGGLEGQDLDVVLAEDHALPEGLELPDVERRRPVEAWAARG